MNKIFQAQLLNHKTITYIIMVPFLSLLLTVPLYAKQKLDILVCLGQEEKYFHDKKITGPRYNLNQIFINDLAAIKDVRLGPKFLERICRSGSQNVSLSLLMGLLIERETLFILNMQQDESVSIFEMRKSAIDVLLNDSPHIFFRYIAELQSQTPFPHCLTSKIPDLKYFTEKLKYLEGDIPIEQIINDKRRFRSIFEKLKDYETIYKECQVLQKDLDIKRSRKTTS